MPDPSAVELLRALASVAAEVTAELLTDDSGMQRVIAEHPRVLAKASAQR